LPEYPSSTISVRFLYVQSSQNQMIYSDVLDKQENDGQEEWICGREMVTKTNKDNEVQCFCPPAVCMVNIVNILVIE
jgi:hypothetical protein